MKTQKFKILPVFFLAVFLSAFSSGLYLSLRNSLPELAHYSKHKELKANSNSNSGSEEFVYEENETENEIESGLELQALILPFFASAFYNHVVSDVNFTFTFTQLFSTAKPIYLSVCNFRI